MLIHTLKTTLGQAIFGLSRHRIDLLCKLLPALIQTRTVNLRTLACALPALSNDRQSVSPPAAFFQRWPLPECIYPTHCRQTRRRGATDAVGLGSDALAVRPDRSESAVPGLGVSRGIDSVGLPVATPTGQLPYPRAEAGDAPGPFR